MLSTRVSESTVVSRPIDEVWRKIKAFDFSWWSLVKAVTPKREDGGLTLGASYSITFKDDVKWDVNLVELSDLSVRSLSFEIVATEPATSYSSAIHTISLERVTQTQETFVKWMTEYSNDVSLETSEDSRFKKLEAFNDLKAACK